jgi:transcriptional regulator with XRE-family HTH domain
MDTVGKRVRHAREQKGMNQADLARAIGIAVPTLHLMEKRPGGTQHLPAIAQVLGVNVQWLASGKGPVRLGSDAKLSKAAPAMLAALHRAEAFILGFEDDDTQEGIADLLGVIRDAIAKAEG